MDSNLLTQRLTTRSTSLSQKWQIMAELMLPHHTQLTFGSMVKLINTYLLESATLSVQLIQTKQAAIRFSS